MAFVPDYGLLISETELRGLVDSILRTGLPFGFDIETGYDGESREKASLHPEENFVVGISFTNSVRWARYVPVRHDSGVNMDPRIVAEIMWPLFMYRDKEGLPIGVAHGAIFELRCLRRWFLKYLGDHPEYGPQVRECDGYFPLRSCTMLESYVSGDNPSHGLKPITKRNWGHEMTELLDLFPDGLTQKEQRSIRFNPLDQHDPKVASYACEDSLWCLVHHLKRWPRVRNLLIYKVEMGVLYEVAEMADDGFLMDWNLYRETAAKASDFSELYKMEVYRAFSEITGQPCNINLGSSKQLGKLLYEDCGMPISHRTGKGAPATDAKIALKGLSKQYEAVRKLLNWKGITKLRNTYLDKWEGKYSYASDGRVHPDWMQHGTISGRFACADPNAQNPPKKYYYELSNGNFFKFNFREGMVVSPEGWYNLGFDYSQLELRIIAGESGEEALLKAFEDGIDVHKLTAALMLGVRFEEVTEEQRTVGKAQPLYEKVLTPQGWREMGSLSVGDQVIGSSGEPVKVTGVYPRGVRKVYKVVTSDGAEVECCDEHLWTVKNINTKPETWRTRQLKDLIDSGLNNTNGQPKYELPPRPVVRYEQGPDLPVDPYVLGLLLGDGGFTQEVQYCSADRELMRAVSTEHVRLGGRKPVEVEQRPGFWTCYLRAGPPFDRNGNKLKQALRNYGLEGKRDHQKFVPPDYLKSSPENRLAVLQGLLDTDGTVLASGAQFRVVSEQLARDVQALARSLGGFASLRSYQRPRSPVHVKSDPQLTWDVYLRLPADVCPFRLERKAQKWKPPRYAANQRIVSVEEVMPTEVQCIAVDAEDHLYVTQGNIVTHNTMNFALKLLSTA